MLSSNAKSATTQDTEIKKQSCYEAQIRAKLRGEDSNNCKNEMVPMMFAASAPTIDIDIVSKRKKTKVGNRRGKTTSQTRVDLLSRQKFVCMHDSKGCVGVPFPMLLEFNIDTNTFVVDRARSFCSPHCYRSYVFGHERYSDKLLWTTAFLFATCVMRLSPDIFRPGMVSAPDRSALADFHLLKQGSGIKKFRRPFGIKASAQRQVVENGDPTTYIINGYHIRETKCFVVRRATIRRCEVDLKMKVLETKQEERADALSDIYEAFAASKKRSYATIYGDDNATQSGSSSSSVSRGRKKLRFVNEVTINPLRLDLLSDAHRHALTEPQHAVCMHDTEPYFGVPFPLPILYCSRFNEFTVSLQHTFCSMACLKTFVLNTSSLRERGLHTTISLYAYKVLKWSRERILAVGLAPDREVLLKFHPDKGGLSIEEFRHPRSTTMSRIIYGETERIHETHGMVLDPTEIITIQTRDGSKPQATVTMMEPDEEHGPTPTSTAKSSVTAPKATTTTSTNSQTIVSQEDSMLSSPSSFLVPLSQPTQLWAPSTIVT